MTTTSPVAGWERLAANTIFSASGITDALQRMTGTLLSNYLSMFAAPSFQKTIKIGVITPSDDGSRAGEHVQVRTLVYSLQASTQSQTKIYIHSGKNAGTKVLRDEFISQYLDSMAVHRDPAAAARVLQVAVSPGHHVSAVPRRASSGRFRKRRRPARATMPRRVVEPAVLPRAFSLPPAIPLPDTRLVERAADALDAKTALRHELQADFIADPVEDGMDHEAENTLARALAGDHREATLEWLREFCTDAEHPAFASSVLRCLGNLDYPGSEEWRAAVVRDALATGNTQVKDAAVQAVEKWGESGLVHVLRTHQEDVPWLQEYIQGVIDDLGG